VVVNASELVLWPKGRLRVVRGRTLDGEESEYTRDFVRMLKSLPSRYMDMPLVLWSVWLDQVSGVCDPQLIHAHIISSWCGVKHSSAGQLAFLA
jgi:hypothetical protein